MNIRIQNNPGIASAKLKLTYDTDLTLLSVSYNSSLGGSSQQPQYLKSPLILNWYNGAANTYGDMVYATLRFKVSDSAAIGTHTVKITYDPDDVFNISEKNINFDIVNGTVTVTSGQTSVTKYVTTSVGNVIRPADQGLSGYSWTSLDQTVASVTSAGTIRAMKAGNATLSGTNSSGKATIELVVEFKDVKSGTSRAYYYDAVYWAVDKGITGGVKNTGSGLFETFDPQGQCTRAQMVAFLWRMAGCPQASSTAKMPFKDVRRNDYYYQAVLWGYETGVVGGYPDGKFHPANVCTRGQAVSFIWRYYGTPEPKTTQYQFSDNKDSKQYYYKAVLWASEKGITGGYSDGTFRPQETCTRAQMVSFLYRGRSL